MGEPGLGKLVLVLAATESATPAALCAQGAILHQHHLPVAVSLPLDRLPTATWPAGALAGLAVLPQLATLAETATQRLPHGHRHDPPPWLATVAALRTEAERLGGTASPAYCLAGGPLAGDLLAALSAAGLVVCLDSPVAGEGPGEPLCLAHTLLCPPAPEVDVTAPTTWGEWASGLMARPGTPAAWSVRLSADLPPAQLDAFCTWLTAEYGADVIAAATLATWHGRAGSLSVAELPLLCHEVGLRLHPVQMAGTWWSVGESFSALVQHAATVAEGATPPAHLTPVPLLGPPVTPPALAEVLVRRSEVLDACRAVCAWTTAHGTVPAVVAVGRHSVTPTTFLYAVAHALAGAEPSFKIPAGPIPILDATRRHLRQYADTLARRPQGGPWLRQRLLDHCWSAKPASPP